MNSTLFARLKRVERAITPPKMGYLLEVREDADNEAPNRVLAGAGIVPAANAQIIVIKDLCVGADRFLRAYRW
jgi:hypothetical protein